MRVAIILSHSSCIPWSIKLLEFILLKIAFLKIANFLCILVSSLESNVSQGLYLFIFLKKKKIDVQKEPGTWNFFNKYLSMNE